MVQWASLPIPLGLGQQGAIDAPGVPGEKVNPGRTIIPITPVVRAPGRNTG